jgi:tRNA dimethylallyltransferase
MVLLKKGVVDTVNDGGAGQAIPLLAIVGPTATGKTETGVTVAEAINGEIISADSMLVYRHMDIGTAKPSPGEKRGIPHHMIDIIDPEENFTVAIYAHMVHKLIPAIWKNGKIPILVGGTGLYIRSVVDGFNFAVTGPDLKYRKSLEEYIILKGSDGLHDLLAACDPVTAARLHPNDTKRIIRALEVFHQTGKSISALSNSTTSTHFNLLMFGLTMNREKLYGVINNRVDQMIDRGLVAEVKNLLARGYDEGMNSMQGLGYKEILLYLKGEITLSEAVDTLKRSTRRFAKRQLTWFNRDKRIRWLNVDNYQNNREIAEEIICEAAGTFNMASNPIKKKIIPMEGAH